jgi:hypothetical protein
MGKKHSDFHFKKLTYKTTFEILEKKERNIKIRKQLRTEKLKLSKHQGTL